MPSLLILNPGTDIAGCGIALKRAFERHSDWQAWHVRRVSSTFDYPVDRDWSELPKLWRRATYVHVMDDPRILRQLPSRRNVLVQHLGSTLLRNPAGISRLCDRYGVKQASSGFYLPTDAPWLPLTTDLNLVESLRTDHQPGKVRIAHAPTDRALKSTDLIIEAVERLDVEFDLIEGVTQRECLGRKARADIFVDELTYGYGLNAIESWILGLPVVSGMTVGREAFLRMAGRTPWDDATPDTLYDVIRRLVEDSTHRASAAKRGRDFVEQYHHPAVVVARHMEMYA